MNSLFQTHRSCCLAWGLNPAERSIKFKAWVLPHWGRVRLDSTVLPRFGCDDTLCYYKPHLLVILCACEGILQRHKYKLSSAPVSPMGVSRSCSVFPIKGGRKGHTVPNKQLPSADKVWSAVWKSSFLPPSPPCCGSVLPLILSAVVPPLKPLRPASLTAAHAWKPAWVQCAVQNTDILNYEVPVLSNLKMFRVRKKHILYCNIYIIIFILSFFNFYCKSVQRYYHIPKKMLLLFFFNSLMEFIYFYFFNLFIYLSAEHLRCKIYF